MATEDLWDGDINKLPKQYISDVKQMFMSQGAQKVRFGILGKGIAPNYELHFENGKTQARYGSGKIFPNTEKFIEDHTTKFFTLDELKAAQLSSF